MARTYKRDSRGRFAGGGGGSGGKGGGTSKPASKPSGGNRGPRGGKVGTRAEQQRNARAQQQRTKAFSSKATVGRSAKEAYKAASGAKRKAGGKRLTGLGRAPATKLPSASSDAYKYNKAGLLASPQERQRMRARDRAREKNAALAQQQAAGMRRAERRAARKLTSDRTDPGSVLRHSSTYNAAERAIKRRTGRASANFSAGSALERQKNSLIQKALKMQQKASERKAQGRNVTKTAEANFQQVRRQIGKIDRSLATRRRAMDVVTAQSRRMETNTRSRYRY